VEKHREIWYNQRGGVRESTPNPENGVFRGVCLANDRELIEKEQ